MDNLDFLHTYSGFWTHDLTHHLILTRRGSTIWDGPQCLDSSHVLLLLFSPLPLVPLGLFFSSFNRIYLSIKENKKESSQNKKWKQQAINSIKEDKQQHRKISKQKDRSRYLQRECFHKSCQWWIQVQADHCCNWTGKRTVMAFWVGYIEWCY